MGNIISYNNFDYDFYLLNDNCVQWKIFILFGLNILVIDTYLCKLHKIFYSSLQIN